MAVKIDEIDAVHVAPMLSRVRNHFQGAKFARMSSGTYCIIRDLGLVKGGKGMRHHEVLVTFSFKAAWRWMAGVSKAVVGRRKALAGFRAFPNTYRRMLRRPSPPRQRCAACHANSRLSAIDIATDVT